MTSSQVAWCNHNHDIFQKERHIPERWLPCIFGEESLGKIKNAKDGSFYEFYHLKALYTLEQVNTSVFEKKRDLYEQNFDGAGGGGAN